MWEAKGDIVSHGASTFARLAVGSDDTVLIADSSAGSGLSWGQVGTANIAADAVTNAKIAANAVDSAEIATGAVGTDELAADAVNGTKIAADAVDGTKIADESIDSEHYVDGSIDTAHLAAGAVDGTIIDNNAVTNAKLSNMAAHTVKVRQSSTGDPQDLVVSENRVVGRASGGTVTGVQVQTDMIANDAVDGTKIANDSINSEHYVDESIDRVHLAADIIDGTKIANDVINSEHYVNGSIDNAHIANSTITSAKVDTSSILITGSTSQSKSGKLTLTYSQPDDNWDDCQLIINSGGDAGIALRSNNDTSKQTFMMRAARNPISDRSAAYFRTSGDDGAADVLAADFYSDTGYIFCSSAAVYNRFRFKTNGSGYPDADINCKSVTETSARRFKENIVDAYVATDTDAIELLNDIDFAEFSFIGDESERRVKGVIADDLVGVMPEAVMYDENNEVSGVETQRMTYLALGALKQALNKIDSLEARIAELESN
jgi:hypothetical protein